MAKYNYTKSGKKSRVEIYEYVRSKGKEWISVKEVAIDLNISRSIAYHFITKMIKEGFFESKKVVVNRITNMYIRLEASHNIGLEDAPAEELPDEIPKPASHVRVVKLLDNPLPKPPESKRKSVTMIGSSMSLFNSY